MLNIRADSFIIKGPHGTKGLADKEIQDIYG